MRKPTLYQKSIGAVLISLLVLFQYPSVGIAQDAEQESAGTKVITLPASTPINLILLEEINSQRNREGDEIIFAVAEDVVIMGRIYLVKGTPAIGRVTHVKTAKGWGKSGNFDVELTSLTPLYSMPVKLTGETASSTGSKAVKAIAVTAVLGVSVVGLLAGGSVKGKKARIDAGTNIAVYSAEDGNIMDISTDEMRKMVDDWYIEKITTNFLNYSWDGKRTISETMIAMGYSIDKAAIVIKPLENYNYQVDVPLNSNQIASFKFQPFEEGYTSKRRTIVEMNEPARLILKAVK